MSELYDHQSHEPVTDTAWSEAAARAAIGEIAADAEAAFDPETLWHAHPLDTDGGPLPSPTGFYLGASGVIWALDALRRAGAVELRRDWPEVAAGLPDRYAAAPDLPESTGGGAVPSLLVGEAGILLVAHRLAPAQWQVDRLLEVVRGNVHNPTRELMWGSPGTMLAAQLMHERARDDRFADAWRESADWLWDEWGDELSAAGHVRPAAGTTSARVTGSPRTSWCSPGAGCSTAPAGRSWSAGRSTCCASSPSATATSCSGRRRSSSPGLRRGSARSGATALRGSSPRWLPSPSATTS